MADAQEPMIAATDADPILLGAVVFLAAAVVVVLIFRRIGMGSVLGYLAAGALIGPYGLGAIGETETVLHVAEFGVVLLLFVIGLELKPARLWRLRSDIFGLGLLQVTVTGAALTVALLAFGQPFDRALLVGLALALSSTAFGVQILREKRDLAAPYGDRAFSILLFQDLAIVPLLALAAFLAPGPGVTENVAVDIVIGLGALVALVLAGRYLVPQLFAFIAREKAHEIFSAAALLVVGGAALAMDAAGLSMALGAFIAGVLMAESSYRHQLETDIEPFRGLLLGLFFMAFGMTVDWAVVLANWWIVLGGAAGLFLLKAVLLYLLSRLFGSGHIDAVRIAATLGQGGEFAFVLLSIAAGSGLLFGTLSSVLSAVITLSMVLTPLAVRFADQAAAQDAGGDEDDEEMEGVDAAKGARVIIAGFGRVGQVVARIMAMRGLDVTLIDNSPRRIRMARSFGTHVYFGDATRLDVMISAGAGEADIIFLCIDDRDGARAAVEKLRERFPQALIIADTYDRFSEIEMRAAGADVVIRETRESAIALAREGLMRIGDAAVVDELVEEYRRRDGERTALEKDMGPKEALEILRAKYALERQG
ncbi:MAG: monovalent cation:proton antiporter-2 (CPA2) family protein [Pseudomonadota bacterium]